MRGGGWTAAHTHEAPPAHTPSPGDADSTRFQLLTAAPPTAAPKASPTGPLVFSNHYKGGTTVTRIPDPLIVRGTDEIPAGTFHA